MSSPLHRIISKNSLVQVSTPAPDLKLTALDGSQVNLSEYWTKQPIVAVFLRHLGCTFCRQHVLQLKSKYAEYKAAGADVVCVAMGPPELGKAFRALFDLPMPILMTGDETTPFQAYGLGRGTIGELLGINSWIKGFLALFTLGLKVLGTLQGDGMQMPGTFIIDRNGIIRVAYRSKDAADNPSNTFLLENLRQLQEGPQIDVMHSRATA